MMPKFTVKITGFRSWFRDVEAVDADMAEHIVELELNTRFGDRREWGFEVFAYAVNGEDF
jgi:hypothetical protein